MARWRSAPRPIAIDGLQNTGMTNDYSGDCCAALSEFWASLMSHGKTTILVVAIRGGSGLADRKIADLGTALRRVFDRIR